MHGRINENQWGQTRLILALYITLISSRLSRANDSDHARYLFVK
jgi:hypothetical protein